MKRLLKNASVVNVFLDRLEQVNVLLENERIIGVGDYQEEDADVTEDLSGRIICPGFIDGHIHIESSMLQPAEFARACLPHGTTSIIADPHEIANVSGMAGVAYMISASEHIPMSIYYVVPSCVPSTPFDEAGGCLSHEDIQSFLSHPMVVGLGEMMNYPGVLADDPEVFEKIRVTKEQHLVVNGHAPLLTGRNLDKYIASGIFDDHECSNADEAMERIQKGQWVMIRQGTAAHNLEALLPLFEEPYSRRCMLVTDDKHPADLLNNGHIDSIIRSAVQAGKSPLTAIRMATFQAAQYFGLRDLGAVAPGYRADLVILDDLNTVHVTDVYKDGDKVVTSGEPIPFALPMVRTDMWKAVRNSFCLDPVHAEQFHIEPKGRRCRVIRMIPKQLLTQEVILDIDFSKNNGVDIERDILKIAVIERHTNSGHIGLGYIQGMGLRHGAIASSVSHDSHNLIVVGATDEEMALAANRVRELGGGLIVVDGDRVLAEMPLPIGGLMGKEPAAEMARQNEAVRGMVKTLGISEEQEPFMSLAFMSLPVIPDLKMTTMGLVNVNEQRLLPLFAE